MNNIYAYSDAELEEINSAMPKVLSNLKFLIAPIDDDELHLVSAFLLGGLIHLRREMKRREEAKRDVKGRMEKFCSCGDITHSRDPKDAA